MSPNYCFIESGAVVNGPTTLPTNWRNISNLPCLSDAELAPLGWLPVTPVTPPTYDPNTQSLTRTYAISATAVTPVFVVKKLSPEQVASILAARKVTATNQVNRDCGVFRASIATDIPFQSEVYAAKQTEAARYANDPTPNPADYPYIVAEATTTRMTVRQKVAEITAIATQWVQVSAMVEAKRRGAIVAIDAATSVADVEAAIPTNWP